MDEQKIIDQLAWEDTILHLDSIDPKIMKSYAKKRVKYYENEFLQICNITILDPDIGNKYEHMLDNKCYQEAICEIVEVYQSSYPGNN